MRRTILAAVTLILLSSASAYLLYQGGAGYAEVTPFETETPIFLNVSRQAGLSGVRGDSFVWGDWDKDGYQDLLVKGSRLFRNTGPPSFTFDEVTERVGLENSGYSVWADLDNDGYLDIFSVGHPYSYQDSVWLNQGPPNYEYRNVSHLSGPTGVDDGMPGLAAGAGDIDQDGDLDIYVVNWRDDANVKYPDTLWRNEGGGRFTDITNEAKIVDWNEDRGEPNAGMGVNFGDYNDDGWIDIYVSNYLITPNYLWENQGDGTFIDVARDRGCAGEPTWTPTDTYYGHTAGSQWADYDNDGDLDMWSSNLAHKDPYRTLICDDSQLWRNNGPEAGHTFTNVRDETGIPTVILEQEELFFGIAWGDYDNDGDLDMWIPQVKSYIDYAYSFLFQNNGDGTFTDVSEEAMMRIWDSDGGAWCDYDNDGDLDLITEGKFPYQNGTYEVHLFRNMANNDNHYLHVDLVGTRGNPSAVGARVWAFASETGELLGMREVEGGTAGHSYGPSLTQEFGLGTYGGDVDLEIRWPRGRMQYLSSVRTDRRMEVEEPEANDISVSAEYAKDLLMEGEDLDVSVMVSNMGGSDVRDVTINYLDEWTGGIGWQGTRSIPFIPLGGRIDLEFTFSTGGRSGDHHLEFYLASSSPRDDNAENDRATVEVTVSSVNRPPEINGMVLDTDIVEPGGSISIEVSASDPEEGALTYSFNCPYGTIDHGPPSSNRAVWTAPQWFEVQYGLTTVITVTVTDEEGGSASMKEEVEVLVYDSLPSIRNITISASRIPNDPNVPVVLTAEVLDREGPVASVTVDLTRLGGGSYEPLLDNGLRSDLVAEDGIFTISFRVFGDVMPGEVILMITALDDNGQAASQDLGVTIVQTGSSTTVDQGSNFEPAAALPVLAVLFLLLVPVVYLVVRRVGRKLAP